MKSMITILLEDHPFPIGTKWRYESSKYIYTYQGRNKEGLYLHLGTDGTVYEDKGKTTKFEIVE